MIYWQPNNDINELIKLETTDWPLENWREVVIYLYDFGVIKLGDLFLGYRFQPTKYFPKMARFESDWDNKGIFLSLNEDREIVIVNYNREIIAPIGFFCVPADQEENLTNQEEYF